MMDEPKKSDLAEVAMKPTNKAGLKTAAEPAERRAGTKGNVDQQSTHRMQIRARVSQALGRVRQAAKERKKERFTALLHHVDVDLLRLSFHALKRQAAPGVDGVTWQDYEAELKNNLQDLHARVHRGAYRVSVIWKRALSRRSQRATFTWERTLKLVEDWLPHGRIRHPWPAQRFDVKHPRWEPSA